MSIFILFGPPGAGKTFVGKIFQESFGFHFYDGDEDLTPRMKWAIDHRVPITDSQRDEFFSGLIESIKRLNQTQPHLVIAQTFIKEKYRKWVRREFLSICFIFVHADSAIREKRLLLRKETPLDLEYARKMCLNFDPPAIHHQVLKNCTSGKIEIKRQIRLFLYPHS
ncbi:MAG: AAA family ATPase [Patescibacteria group bacterium]